MTQHLELDFPIPYNTNYFKVGEIEEKKDYLFPKLDNPGLVNSLQNEDNFLAKFNLGISAKCSLGILCNEP